MKITIDIPDKTMCIVFSLFADDEESFLVKTEAHNTDTLYDGSEIKINMEK